MNPAFFSPLGHGRAAGRIKVCLCSVCTLGLCFCVEEKDHNSFPGLKMDFTILRDSDGCRAPAAIMSEPQTVIQPFMHSHRHCGQCQAEPEPAAQGPGRSPELPL